MIGFHVVGDTDEAMAFLRWASERTVIAFDSETTGLDVRAPDFHVRLVQFGDGQESWVIPFANWRGVIEEFFRRFDGTLIAHNAVYDIEALRSEGIDVPWKLTKDSMVACRLAESDKPAGLKPAAARHIAGGAALAQQDLAQAMAKNGWGWDTIPIDYPLYVKYAALDPVLTFRLWEVPLIQRKGFRAPTFQMDMALLEICSMMSSNGMRVDIDYCNIEAAKLRSLTSQIKDQIDEVYGISIGSNAELGQWLIGQGANVTERTEKGQVSVAKDSLQGLMIDPASNPHVLYVCEQVLRYRGAEKIQSSYLTNFINMADDGGFLHPQFNTLAARTSRMSVTRPALQTLPKGGESPDSRIVRNAMIPRRDGDVLVCADFEQIEARLAAVLSQDPKLIEAFAVADAEPGADFFVEVAKTVYREPNFQKSDPRRKDTKGVWYGTSYGAGGATIAKTAGVSLEQATEVRSALLASFPGLSRAMSTYEREAKQNGAVTTLLGREIQCDSELAYRGFNSMVQATAADLFKRSVVNLAQAGFDASAVMLVHDEVVFSLPVEDVEEARVEIAKNMLVDDLIVPIPVDVSGGKKRWAE